MSLWVSFNLLPAQAQEATRDSWNGAQQASADYSLDNLTTLILQSGLGVAFRMPDEVLSETLQQAGLTKLSFQNPYFVQAPYASGDPAYLQIANPSDVKTLLWDPTKMDQTVTPQVLAYTMVSELSWLERFDRQLSSDPQRLVWERWLGHIFGRLAQLAALFAETNLRDSQTGLYYHAWRAGTLVDRSFQSLDQIAMLWALSTLTQASDGSALYDGTVLSHPEAERLARELFTALTSDQGLLRTPTPLGAREVGLWIEALASYAGLLQNPQEINRALQLLQDARSALVPIQQKHPWSLQAEAVTALLTLYRLTGDGQARAEALQRWDGLQKLWDPEANLFVSPSGDVPSYLYSDQELADAVGAFNAVIHLGSLADVQTQYATFFVGALRAVRPQSPSMAIIEPYGRAPVFAASVQFDPPNQRWHIVYRHFDAAGAMYLAARLNWIGAQDGEEFPAPRWGFPGNEDILLYSLRQQLEALTGLVGQGIAERLDALDASIAELKLTLASQAASAKQLADLRQEVTTLSSKLNDEQKRSDARLQDLQSLEQRVTALEQVGPTPSPGRPLSSSDTFIVLLVVLLILAGFVAFEWVRRRPV
jgi:hypothetical protein